MIATVSPGSPTSNRDAKVRLATVGVLSLIAAMGGLLFGWDWVVIGGAKPFYERYFQISTDPAMSGWANSCALIGCLVGALCGGAISDALGRKKLLVASAALFAITSIGNALATSFASFVSWRIFGGVAIGLASTLSPMYIAEIAPARIRGMLVSLNQLTIVLGVLGAQLVNWWVVRDLPEGATEAFIAGSWFGQTAWRWMFGLTAIPSVLFLVGMSLAPESPRWLVRHGERERARRLLIRINGEVEADSELKEIEKTLSGTQQKVALRDLAAPRMRALLSLGIVLAVFQQWCGINVIFNYAEDIFRAAGFDLSNVLSNIAWTGSVNLVFTLVAIRFVDRVGRRPLMLFGAASLAVVYLVLGTCFKIGVVGLPMLLLVLVAIACYAMSLAPVTWVIIAEIFPNAFRGAAVAIAVGALWMASFVLTFTFPLMNAWLGAAGVFWVYSGICTAGLLYMIRYLKETKGRTLEELERANVG